MAIVSIVTVSGVLVVHGWWPLGHSMCGNCHCHWSELSCSIVLLFGCCGEMLISNCNTPATTIPLQSQWPLAMWQHEWWWQCLYHHHWTNNASLPPSPQHRPLSPQYRTTTQTTTTTTATFNNMDHHHKMTMAPHHQHCQPQCDYTSHNRLPMSQCHNVKSRSSPGQSLDKFWIKGDKDGRAEVGLGWE